MRALEPRESGNLTIQEFGVYFEDFGDVTAPPILLLPSWQIVPSRHWKMQIPHLARTRRVVTFDPPGIGGGERTADPQAFNVDRVVDYAVGVLDHLEIERADIAGLSLGGTYAIWLAGTYPERVNKTILVNPVLPEWALAEDPSFWEERDTYDGMQKRNANYWRSDFDGWLTFFFELVASEPHSTKLIDDFVSWGKETTPEVLISSVVNEELLPRKAFDEILPQVKGPVLLISGTGDQIADFARSEEMAAARPDFEFVAVEQGSHALHGRQPVRTNLEIDTFLGPISASRRHWAPGHARSHPRALFISSPIGLGHVQRGLAIANELRREVPDLQIEWLAQHPVTTVLERSGERIHPMSSLLASESTHWERAAHEHHLHCFQAFRDMDEILLANFMVFLDAVRETPYDLWIGDEAWEVDHFLHENPELKSAPYVFMTDFVGWMPIDRSTSSREAMLTADYNAQMIEQVKRFPAVRDRSLYFGSYEDLLPERFGPSLPSIPDWTHEHFDAIGYVTAFDPNDYVDKASVRRRLGYDPDQPLVILTVGGTGVGTSLLRKVMQAWPLVHRERPEVHCVAVAGPRVETSQLPRSVGLDIVGYVHNLYEHLAVCDLALVQGGLSTTMELTVSRRPFIYVPIRDHCEQVYHVAHRLDRYHAGTRLDYDALTPESLAEAILDNLSADTSGYLPHVDGAATRAARRIAQLL